jgi:hypothetical protein
VARFSGGSGGEGTPGPAGASAYEIAVDNGFVGTEQEWLDSIGSTADIADFIFTNNGGDSTITLPGAKEISIISGDEEDLYITSGDDLYLTSLLDDIFIRANDDISFTSNYENEGTEFRWSMDSNGLFKLPGSGYISNPANSSGDGGNNDTIQIVPDDNRHSSDQYIIIDPTAPSHIHIRAGGTQDASTADLFLGAEQTNVKVSDNNGAIRIQTTYENNIIQLSNEGVTTSDTFVTTANPELNWVIGEGWTVRNANDTVSVPIINSDSIDNEVTFTVAEEDFFVPDGSYQFFPPASSFDGDIQWEFAPNGAIYGPAMGGVRVPAITNVQAGEELFVYANKAQLNLSSDKNVRVYSDEGDIILNSDVGGEYLGSANSPDNQIATLGDINTAVTPVDTAFTVVGGTLGDAPTFTGAPLFTGSYVKAGAMVHFRVDVDFDNILTFGTGQYYINLPFTPKYNYMFTGGCLHDASTGRTYAISGHVFAGNPQMRLESTDNTGNTTFNIPFTYNNPITLSTADNFHLYGDFIVDVE